MGLFQVCSGGPVDIYYIPSDEPHPENKFAFQVWIRCIYVKNVEGLKSTRSKVFGHLLKPKRRSSLKFQIFTCWEPLLCSTAKCFTRVVCQSDVPVFVSNFADVCVDVSILAPSGNTLLLWLCRAQCRTVCHMCTLRIIPALEKHLKMGKLGIIAGKGCQRLRTVCSTGHGERRRQQRSTTTVGCLSILAIGNLSQRGLNSDSFTTIAKWNVDRFTKQLSELAYDRSFICNLVDGRDHIICNCFDFLAMSLLPLRIG